MHSSTAPRMRLLPLVVLGVLGVVLLAPGAARAQVERFDVQAFRPVGAPQDLAVVEQSRPLAGSSLVGGVFVHHMLDPLVLVRQGSRVKAVSLVGSRLQVDVLAAAGLWDWGEVGLALPLVVAQGGDNLEAIGTEGPVRPWAVGDLRLHGKLALPGLRRSAGDSGLGAALTLGVGLPTGSVEAFAGEGAVTWEPGLVVDWRWDSGALLSLNTGLWLRPRRNFINVRWGSLATLGLGAELPITPSRRIAAVGLLTAATPLEGLSLSAPPHQLPAEVLVGLRWYGGQGLTYTLGAGGGCSCSLTAPALRLFASVSWVPPGMPERQALEQSLAGEHLGPTPATPPETPLYAQPVDADNDYVIAPLDECPLVAGPVENKGCPDKDTDSDGVVDRLDKCPSHAQSPKGNNGCPLARLEAGRLVLSKPVQFVTGQPILHPDSEPVLEEVARVLLEYPRVQRVDVQGRAEVATEEQMTLAQQRATKVRQWLLEEGIAMDRLCTAVQVAPEHQGPPGGRVEFTMPATPQPCPEAVAGASRKKRLNLREQAWELASTLKRDGAWLALGVRARGSRQELLWHRAQEGWGSQEGAARSEAFEQVLKKALARHVPENGTAVVVLGYEGGTWWMMDEASGQDLMAELPDTHYRLWIRQELQSTRSEERARTLREALRWFHGQPDWFRYSAAPAPWDLERAYEKAMAREEARRVAEERKLDEYIQWAERFHRQQVLPPFLISPGHLVSESPLRQQAVEALIRAVLEWGSKRMREQDPAFLELRPEEVAQYLLASRTYLADLLKAGEAAPMQAEYNPALDPEAYTLEELALEVGVSLVPGVGEGVDLYSLHTKETLTGKRLSGKEAAVTALALMLPFVSGAVISKGPALAERAALLSGRSVQEMEVLARVASHLSAEDAKEIERAVERLGKGGELTAEELEALERIAQKLQGPVSEAVHALKAGGKVPMLGVRTLPDGSRLVVGSPAHQAQCWVDYQLRHMERYKGFRYEVDPEWRRLYDSILANKPAGTGFELDVLKFARYEKNSALMMPPPGKGLQGFIPDAVKGNPTELVWGRPYHFVEVKAWKELSLTGNLKAMLEYVNEYGGHVELWIRSSKHASGPTQISSNLRDVIEALMSEGKANLRYYP